MIQVDQKDNIYWRKYIDIGNCIKDLLNKMNNMDLQAKNEVFFDGLVKFKLVDFFFLLLLLFVDDEESTFFLLLFFIFFFFEDEFVDFVVVVRFLVFFFFRFV